ncbi:MAG: DUF6272 family protein [Vicingaceae bacterium]|nr:DUF6272 family protein [Vicingaceae bacterium]
MSLGKQYQDCEKIILKNYQDLRNRHSDNLICSHIGEFSQEILISLVSLTANSLLKAPYLKGFKRRLEYIIIEIVQNIIAHSDKIQKKSQLAYFMVVEEKDGFQLYSTNTILNKNAHLFVDCINNLIESNTDELNTILKKHLKLAELDKSGRAGIGLLSILYKTDKNFAYELIQIGEEVSILNLSLTLKKEMA